MSDYEFMPDGTVKGGGREIAFFDQDGTVRDRRNGHEIGFVESDGTVRDRRNGQEIGFVESDGTVRDRRNGHEVGHVKPPALHNRGAMLILFG